MKTIVGTTSAKGLRLAIAVSRFNEFVTERLLTAALATIVSSGGDTTSTTVLRVPGAFELPLAAQKLAATGRFDGVICLGAVIRGETSHFEYISRAAAHGITRASLASGVPMTFGVITAESAEQAMARAGEKGSNKGEEATLAIIELITALQQIDR